MRLYDSPAAFTSDEWLDNHMSVLFLSPHLSRVAFRVTCKLWGQKTRFRSPSNSTAVLNLNCSLVFFFNSFSLYFFEKSTKNGGSCVQHSVLPLFKSCFATSFSRCTPRRSLLVAMLGVARTRCAQTSCHLFPSIARLLTVPPNAALPPLAGNYLCYENLLECIADFNAYNSNIKETPAVSKSQRKSLLFGGHCARHVQT